MSTNAYGRERDMKADEMQYANETDGAKISEIVSKARVIAARHGREIDALSTEMDLHAVHANIVPLRLDDMLKADDFNLAHDVFGIERHLNRETIELEGHFLPRFAVRKEATR